MPPTSRGLGSNSRVATPRVPCAGGGGAASDARAVPSSATIAERTRRDRNISYYRRDPASHAFALIHDYTEIKAGTEAYVSIVRAGSTVSDPYGTDLDDGTALRVDHLHGDAIRAAAPDAEGVDAKTEAVAFRFPPVPAGGSRRLRFAETYTDPERYRLVVGELVWHRSLGRADNAVVLPARWRPTNGSVPATVSETADGRTRIDVLNPRGDEVDVIVTARHL